MNISHYVVSQPELLESPRLRIPRFGIHERLPAQIIHRPHDNDTYLFMLFHTTVVAGCAPGAPFHPAETCIVWKPGQQHWYGNAEKSWDHSWIHFAGSDVSRLVSKSALTPGIPWIFRQPHVFERFLLAVHTEISTHAAPDSVILLNLLHNLLREFERAQDGEDGRLIPEEFLVVKEYIDTHYQLPLRLTQLAQKTFLSVPRFCVLFKRWFGYAAIDYVVRLRMQHAAFLLRDVNMRIKQVAESVGYDDLYHFSKLFRKHYGVSPRKYRGNRIGK